ncbi:MAG: hypothetical protein ACLPZR_28105 [Solirubrobacteraceae bacterium]
MPESVGELLVTEVALAKLGARSISAEEAEQLPRNAHAIVRNSRDVEYPAPRRLLIGRTDGGRHLLKLVASAGHGKGVRDRVASAGSPRAP